MEFQIFLNDMMLPNGASFDKRLVTNLSSSSILKSLTLLVSI